jgi:hypothetical protein
MLKLQMMGGVSEHRTTLKSSDTRVTFSAGANLEVSTAEFKKFLQRLRDTHKHLGVPHPGIMVKAECKTMGGPVILECEHDRAFHLAEEYLDPVK